MNSVSRYSLQIISFMVRLDGVEPTSDAYKASALPLSYRRNYYIIQYKKLIISKFIDDLKADAQPTR